MSEERSRTFTWQDPMIGAKLAQQMSGIEYLQKMAQGEIPAPPIARMLDIGVKEVSAGRVVFFGHPQEFHYNPIGVVHGGFAATILDSALGCSVQSILPAGSGYTTLELHVNLVRAITMATGELDCIGEVIHSGKTIATAQAKLVDQAGKLYAHATTTCLIFRAE